MVTTQSNSIIANQMIPATALREHKKHFIRALLMGPSKSGKTTSALTLPGKTLYVGMDNREAAIESFSNVDLIKLTEFDWKKPKAWHNLICLYEEILAAVRAKNFGYSNLILDSVSAMSKIAMNASLQLTKTAGKHAGQLIETLPGNVPGQAHYTPVMYDIERLLFGLLALPINLVVCGYYEFREISIGKGLDRQVIGADWFPKVVGNARAEFAGWFDESYECFSTTASGRRRYYWNTHATKRLNFLGSGLNQLGRYWPPEPIEIDFNQSSVGFVKLLELRFGKETNYDSA